MTPQAFKVFFVLCVAATPFFVADATAQTQVKLATIPESIPAVRSDGTISTPDRPGFRVEVLRAAGKTCGANITFLPFPWQRVLESVKTGAIDGGFSASWSEDRALYGMFPLKNGAPDPSRAMKSYAYSLYIHPGSMLKWNGSSITGPDLKVIVERGSAAIAIAKRYGLEPIEASGYANMVKMLVEKRASGLVAIDTHVDNVLRQNPELTQKFKELKPELESVNGYLMFSKAFYRTNTALAECLWKSIGEIRATPAYKDLVRSYNNGEFAE